MVYVVCVCVWCVCGVCVCVWCVCVVCVCVRAVYLFLFPEPPDLTNALILRQGCTVEHVVSELRYLPDVPVNMWTLRFCVIVVYMLML